MENYNPREIEEKWQKYWAENPELYVADDKSEKKKKYILDMFPYPSGDGLHVGHVESYTATDIISRYSRMRGFNVLHPQGWDAFGLPAENYAIKTKIHPQETTKKAVATFKGQMNKLGLSYDWTREINSSDPGYYKWTQWFFLLLYKNGWAYKKKANVNWCPKCQTVLANEQAENGACERCKTEVAQKDLEQWFFKITDFIEPSFVKTSDGQGKIKTTGLIDGLEKVDWPESIKAAQKNWIGKSTGTQFKMQVSGTEEFIEVYTTRIDTIYGCTYCVVAPEHKIVQELKDKIENWDEVEKYLIESQNKTELERMETKDKTGVELKGIKLANPFNGEDVPLYVADYVLAHYGTGAVMAVPAHDERDFEFAKKYNLKIIEVIKNAGKQSYVNETAFTMDGILINSEKYNGLTSEEAREKMTEWLEKNKLGERKINYKIRDWLVSRQRYWGAPIPIIYCDACGEAPVPEEDLPVVLPTDVDFKPTGESPLNYSKSFHNVKCPKCGGKARRESDTMDTFVCSSWYYFRYADPQNEKEFASREMTKKWLPVDLYVGGAEHAVLHLLYARFFTKVLHNLGYIDFDEPFLKLRNQGLILAEDGRKMSKSLGNVVNPDQVVEEFGADSLRMFEMFMGPLEDAKPWNTKGIIGLRRFLDKIWKLNSKFQISSAAADKQNPDFNNQNPKPFYLLHKTIKKVTEDIENFRFNTAISAMMILANEMEKEHAKSATANAPMRIEDFEKLLIILSPFAPHIAEELWNKLGNKSSIFTEKWPEYDPELIKDEKITLVLQVNGKVRDSIEVDAGISETEAKELAMQSEKIKKYIINKEIKKVIFIKGKLINIAI